MAHTVQMIGIEPAELAWIRLLVRLLRHPDPVVPELARQALNYLEGTAGRSGVSSPELEAAAGVQKSQQVQHRPAPPQLASRLQIVLS